jgi:hypothetical protein
MGAPRHHRSSERPQEPPNVAAKPIHSWNPPRGGKPRILLRIPWETNMKQTIPSGYVKLAIEHGH